MTNCDVCPYKKSCFGQGKIDLDDECHWVLKDGQICMKDEDAERWYALFRIQRKW